MTNQKSIIAINPPPDDLCCQGCGIHITKLPTYKDGKTKLFKNFRARLVNTESEYIEASWECCDCIKK